MQQKPTPALLILNQMAGPMTWELAEDSGKAFGCVALLTGHPDTLQKSHPNVLLFAATAYERGGFVRRVLTWLIYCWQAFWWIMRWPKTIPILLFSNPPILVWVIWLLYLIRRQPYTVMVHDIYPDLLVRTQVLAEKHFVIRIWCWLNRQAYQHAVAIMTLGEYMAATLSRQFDSTKTATGRIEVIPPWVDTDVIKPIPKAENWFAQQYNQVGKLTVMYSGNMGIGHDIETFIEVAYRLRHQNNIQFMFIGSGPKWNLVEDAVKKSYLPNVTLLGWLAEEKIPFSLATADVALVSLEIAFEGVMVPSKGTYSMAAGSGLVLLSPGENEMKMWVETMNLGRVFTPSDVSSIVNQLTTWANEKENLANIRSNALSAAKYHFSRKTCTLKIIDYLYNQLRQSKKELYYVVGENGE